MLKFFRDRADGGRRLAEKLSKYAGRPDLLVLALPRGGVPVGFEVSQALSAPLDVLVVRKLGVPGQEELAMGAIASGGAWVLNNHLIQTLQPSIRMIQEVAARELRELTRRERIYRGDRPALEHAQGAPWSWWMTGWQPARRCEPPRPLCGGAGLLAWSWLSRLRHPRRVSS